MSKITDASFIAHQYTSVSRKVLEKANRYTLFENRLRSYPILPPVPHSGRYRDRSIGRSNARAHRRGGRRHGDRPQHARNAGKPAGERGISRNPGLCRVRFQRAFPISRYRSCPPPSAAGFLADSGPAPFRNMRCDRCKPVTRHALLPKGAENAYSRPQALRRASARSVASQVNSGSSRPKWP